MEERTVRLTNPRVAVALGVGLSPAVLWLALNFLRPDLIAPMLDHVFGYGLSAAEVLLVMGGVLIYLVAGLQQGGARVGLWIAGLLMCTLPALFLVLFGPIVFAFMYGNLEAG